MNMAGKSLKNENKRAAVELWRAKVPLSNIRKQLKMSEKTLRRILFFAKANPHNPIQPRKPVKGRPRKISMKTRRMKKKKLQENPSLTAVKLRRSIPALTSVSMQGIQNCWVEAKKPILSERTREQKLVFAREHVNWGVKD
jgi:hypothetical protein